MGGSNPLQDLGDTLGDAISDATDEIKKGSKNLTGISEIKDGRDLEDVTKRIYADTTWGGEAGENLINDIAARNGIPGTETKDDRAKRIAEEDAAAKKRAEEELIAKETDEYKKRQQALRGKQKSLFGGGTGGKTLLTPIGALGSQSEADLNAKTLLGL